jgi:membrane protein implicated in regulation of membrane protease activity
MFIFIMLAICGFIALTFSLLFGHDADHDTDHGDHGGGASVFSTKVILLFITGFGASGAIAAYYNWPVIASSMVGLFFGCLLGGMGYFMVNFFYKQQSDSLVKTSELVGQIGALTTGIAANGLGEVSINFKGQKFYYPAKTKDGSSINAGGTVKIIDSVAGTMIVEQIK